MSVINVYQGNHLILPINITDETGAAIDITGAALEFIVRLGGSLVISKTSTEGGGISVVDESGGSIEIELAADDTAIAAGDYRYELSLTDVVGQPHTVLSGYLHVEKSLMIGG